MKRIFLTGISGFIGGQIAKELLYSGYEVRALVRDNFQALQTAQGIEFVRGDICDYLSVEKGLSGCDAVIHTAGLYKFWVPKPKIIYETNIVGTRNILRAAISHNVERIVYTSSVSTIKLYKDRRLADESLDADSEDLVGDYKRSKFQAELVAREYASQGAPLIILNPTFPVGEGDVKPSPTGKVILDFLKKKIPAYVDTGINIVAIKDVATAHVQALTHGRAGERYLIGNANGNITFKELLSILARISGLQKPGIRIPLWIASTLAYIDQYMEGVIMKRHPRIPLEGTKHASKFMWVNPSKAISELGLQQHSVESALKEAVNWFLKNNYVR